jgi:iron complex transport system ATP-binding protein
VLPQVLEIAFSFGVAEFVAMGRYPHLRRFERLKRNDLRVVEEAMEATDVLHLRERRISELSGGERQRVILAQAFAQEPRLLLLDEPTTHLDIGHQVEVLSIIRKLNREKGLTIIMILHDLNLASEYCNWLILLKEGRIFKEGPPKDVLTYQNIEDVYRTSVVVGESPVSSKPHVFLVPE